MDCTHCESVLLDLCYGELTPAHEREVRAHIHECASCRKALSRLEAGQALARHLPDDPPPPELTERIMRAAEAHARRNNGGFLERVQLLIESMARIAMTRQVAMATLSLLIVFVGLWSIPELTRRREPQTAMVVEPTAEGEAGPSRDLQSSAPESAAQAPVAAPTEPELKASSDASRRNDGARAASARAVTSEAAAKRAAKSERRREAERKLAAETSAPEPAKREEAKGRFAQAPPPLAADPPAERERAAEGLARAPVAPSPDERKALAAPAAESSDDSRDMLGSGAGTMKSSPTASAAASIDTIFRAGVERYRADDYPAAVQLFSRMLESSAPSAQRAAALLYLARSERALGRCDRAIRAYETLVRSYGSSQQSSSALSEGVACYDQVGNPAGATRLLEHANSVPSLSVQASKALQDRSTGAPAAPAGAAEPSPR